jgi:transcriptional regulator with XRE-family HTH domain
MAQKMLRNVQVTVYSIQYILHYFMPPLVQSVPLAARRALSRLGADINTARRRRRLPLDVIAERALTTRQTVARVERGDPSVAIGTFAAVLVALGLVDRLGDVAAAPLDTVGQALEEERLPTRIRRRRTTPDPAAHRVSERSAPDPEHSRE